MVGIDGPGAAGKSTVADLLAARLRDAVVVNVDDFYLPSDVRDLRAGHVGSEFDLPRLGQQVLRPASTGGHVRYQRYDWGTDSLAEWVDVPDGVPLVVEGVYCLERALRDAYTFTVFCRADAAVRLRRGLDRDGEGARAVWVEQWMPAEDAYVAEQRPDQFADVVLDSSTGGAGAEVRFFVDSPRAEPAAQRP